MHILITKNKGKERKGDLTETIGAYERLGLLELRARAVSHQLKKRWRKVEDGKIYELFSYLLFYEFGIFLHPSVHIYEIHFFIISMIFF